MGISSPCANCGADLRVCIECDWYNGEWISKDQYEAKLKADMVAILDKLKAEIEQLPTNTRINWNGCLPDIDYPEIEYVDVSKAGLLEIINKYKAETEDKE